MILLTAKVGPFKSINEPQTVQIDETVTVFVGMNEAGKTVFLQALEKSHDALSIAKFDPVEDYPRKDLPSYLKQHKKEASQVTQLTFLLSDEEVKELNDDHRTNVKLGFTFSIAHKYNNAKTIILSVEEKAVINSLIDDEDLSSDAVVAIKKAPSLRGIPDLLKDISLTEEDKTFLAKIVARIAKTEWESVVQWEVWKWLESRMPKFLYFGDYDILPSKMNLTDLAQRVEKAKSEPKQLKPDHRAILSLLRMADISITDFTNPGGYETLKAKIEGVSISLTDQILEFWKQNEDLEVEVDIKADSEDEVPYNNGPNIYLRIKNRRHRGVSTPFRQRSRGFIWFFSFLVLFDSVQQQMELEGKTDPRDLILLLDEPGLSLHALAQADFLRYIDDLSNKHQVLYSTHSPFMVHSDRLAQVRIVEDQDKIGTVISANVSGSDPRTIFPLQAALGWTIAQNLFISERNLLVEGPSDLIYLKAVSAILESKGRTGLRDDITIVPTGGLDKVVTFVALLGANGLKLVVLHDYRGTPEQKLMDLVKQKMLSPKMLLNASQFRDLKNIGNSGQASDTEDLFSTSLYLDYFNKSFSKELDGTALKEEEVAAGDRIIERIERYLTCKKIQIRPSGGFNHYAVASYFASHPPSKLDAATQGRFEALFMAVNKLYA